MIYVFLPAYNEEVALPRLIPKIDRELKKIGEPFNIVILDDGSRDNSAEVIEKLARSYSVTPLKHEKNQGLGQTIIDGLKYIATVSDPEDRVITLDCDDTHEPLFFHQALEKIKGPYDVVILSRFQKGGREEGLSWHRKLLSRGACLFLKTFFPIPGIKDYSCGFRVFRASILKKAFTTYGDQFIRLPHLGFVVACELLVKLRMLGARITEVPFVLRYDQKPGLSKNNSLRTIVGYFALIRLYWGRDT